MARFRAFLTDSESEAEETTQNVAAVAHPPTKPVDVIMSEDDSEEASSGSESESSQPREHQKRTGEALVRLKDGKNYRASKSRRSESPTDASTSEESERDSDDDESPPLNQPQVDPSLIPRAQQLGVDPQRMHVMQASLFRTEDDIEGVPTRHKALASTLSLARKHSRDSDGEGLRQDSQQVSVCPG